MVSASNDIPRTTTAATSASTYLSLLMSASRTAFRQAARRLFQPRFARPENGFVAVHIPLKLSTSGFTLAARHLGTGGASSEVADRRLGAAVQRKKLKLAKITLQVRAH